MLFRGTDGLETTTKRPTQVLLADGGSFTCEETIQTEHRLEVFINETLTFRLSCSPDHLAELVLGRLITEGIVHDVSEIETLYICEYGTRARVFLRDKTAIRDRLFVESVPSCCTGNQVLNDFFSDREEPPSVTPISWDPTWIFRLAREFDEDTPMHRFTKGSHSCRLAVGGQTLYCCEDLARHNALDKVVGCALRDEVDLTQAILFTSGRIPSDMVMKVVRARVPLFASKAVPTDATIDLADRFHLTLICRAMPHRLTVFTNPAL